MALHSYTADTPRMDEAEANGWVLREARIIERELGHYKDLARKHGWSEAHPRSVYLFISDALKRRDGPKTPPQRYDMEDVGYRESHFAMEPAADGEWVKWEEVSSLFATGNESSK